VVWPANKVRAKLAQGQVVVGSGAYSWSPAIMESAGHAGLDFMRIDAEHSWRQDHTMEHLVLAARYAGVEPIIRVDRDDPYVIRKALEIGAGGIICPQIETPAEAKAVVRAAKFPPKGIRGYSSICHAGGWGKKTGNAYVEWSDREPLIGVMIETASAVEKVEAIMAVDGVDFVLFGPADLSMSYGLRRPDQNHPKVFGALERTIAAARSNGKHVMFDTGLDPAGQDRWAKLGVTMFEIDSDLGICRRTWAANAEALAGRKVTMAKKPAAKAKRPARKVPA